MRPGIGAPAMCHQLRGQRARRSLGKSPMSEAAVVSGVKSRSVTALSMSSVFITRIFSAVILATFLSLLSCSQAPDPNTLVMIIESSPTNLDPRVGIDAQSERIGELLFDALLTRDDHLNVQPGLAERWEIPDP